MRKLLFLALAIIVHCQLSIVNCFAQGEANNWYFGNGAGITFNGANPPSVLTGNPDNIFEGTGTISDRHGNLLAYALGNVVYNKNLLPMQNGSGLAGHWSASQSCIFIPKPGSTTNYYIVTLNHIDGRSSGGMHYSEIDMTLDGGLGGVLASNKNTQLMATSSEKVVVVKHADAVRYWIVGRRLYSPKAYTAFLVDCNGISTTPVESEFPMPSGCSADYYAGTYGYLVASPDGSKLASANGNEPRQTSCREAVELLDFDNATGVLSNRVALTDGGTGELAEAYGVAFSPDGKVLYASNIYRSNSSGQISQWDLMASDVPASRTVVGRVLGFGAHGYTAGALQLGPDGKIYAAQHGTGYLGVINSPNTVGMGCGFVPNAVHLGGKICQLGLPPFVSSFFAEPKYVKVGGDTDEENKDLDFSLEGLGGTNLEWSHMEWDFGDGSPKVRVNKGAPNPTHSYADKGVYTVTVTLYGTSGCPWEETFTQKVTIAYEDIAVTPDHTICEDGSTELQMGNGDGFPIEWTDAAGNVLGTDSIVTVMPSPPGEHAYTVKTLKRTGTNMVANGDFEAGNAGFTTEYKHYNATNCCQGRYAVGTNPSAYNGGFQPCGDHTNGNGKMLILDAAAGTNGVPAGASFWCQAITVEPNTNYGFSAWISSVGWNHLPSTVQVAINGTPIGTKTVSGAEACKWIEYHYVWNSGTATTASICMSELTAVAQGNDFAVDDIAFFKLVEAKKEVKVTVRPKETPTFSFPASLCLGDAPPVLPALSDNGFAGTWSPATVSTSAAGAYTYTFTPDAGECALPTDVTLYVNEVDGGAVSSTNTLICHGGNPGQFTATPAGKTYGNIGYLWQKSTDGGGTWSDADGVNDGENYQVPAGLENPKPATDLKAFRFRRRATVTHNGTACAVHSNNEVIVRVRPDGDCVIFPDKDVDDANDKGGKKGMADPGEVLTYTIKVKSSYHTSNTVNVSDDVPAGTTYVPNSVTGGGTFIPAPAGAHGRGRIEWNNLSIPAVAIGDPMAEVPLSFRVTVNEDMTNTGDRITNTVLVKNLPATAPRPEEADDVEIFTNPNRAYTAAKAVEDLGNNDGLAQAGEVLEYTISIKNEGNVPLAGIAVSDIIPAGTTYENGTASHNGTYTGADKTLNWTVDLAYNETKELKFKVKVTNDLAGINKIENTASVSHPEAGKQTPETTIATDPVVSYTLEKAADRSKTYAKAGDEIDYVITVRNTGTVTLNGITVRDDNADDDTGLGFASVVGRIAPGGTGTVNARHTVTQDDVDAGYVYNLATAATKNPNDLAQDVTATSTDPNPYNCPLDPDCNAPSADHTVVPIVQNPKMEMAKQVANRQKAYDIGDKIEYTITVENTGNVTLSNIAVTDSNADAVPGLVGQNGATNPIPSLAPGDRAEFTAWHTVTPSDANAGKVLNLASGSGKDPNNKEVTAESKDPDCDSCHPGESTDVTIVQNPGLSLKKAADRTKTYNKEGDEIEYTITVRNTGNQTLTDITVTDDKISNSLLAPAFTLQKEEKKAFLVKYTVTQEDVDRGYVYNLAKVKGLNPQNQDVTAESEDPNPYKCPTDKPCSPPSPNHTIVPIEQKPAMEMTKEVDKNRTYKLGERIEYLITVENRGNVTLKNITVTDDNADAVPGIVGRNGATNPIPSLAPGHKAEFLAYHTVTKLDANVGNVYNLAKATGEGPNGNEVTAESKDPDPCTGGGCPPPDPNCPTCPTTNIPIEQNPAMEMTKEVVKKADNKPYKLGERIAYTITVENTGDVALTNIKVADSNADRPNEWSIAILFAGDKETIRAYHTVTQADVDAGHVHNLAKALGRDREGGEVTAESTDPDPCRGEGCPKDPGCPSCTTVPIDQGRGAEMTVTKSVPDDRPYAFGEKIEYVITVANTGDLTLRDILVEDDNADAVPGLVGQNGATNPILELVPGDSRQFTAYHTVDQDDVDRGYVLNIARAKGKDPKDNPVTAESKDPGYQGGDPEDPNCPNCTVTNILRDIQAVDDEYEVTWLQSRFVGGSVLDNDLLNHLPVSIDPSQIVLTPLTPTDPGLVMGEDGRISVRASILPGRYEYPYQICERRIPTNCSSATAFIEILPARDRNRVVIPNVFSPNGDGVNDRFEITGLEQVERVSLEVINRWGNRVFYNEDYRNEWDADDLASGTYYCIIKLYNNAKEERKIKSWILIMR